MKQESILDETERRINDLASRGQSPEIRQKLKEIWFEEIHREEEKSQEIWQKRKQFFEGMQEREESQKNPADVNPPNERKGGKTKAKNKGKKSKKDQQILSFGSSIRQERNTIS